jgi:hypothetical protein
MIDLAIARSNQQQIARLFGIPPEDRTSPPSTAPGFFFDPRGGHRLILPDPLAPADVAVIKDGWAEIRLGAGSPLTSMVAIRFRFGDTATRWFKVSYCWHTDPGKHQPLEAMDAALLPCSARRLTVIFRTGAEASVTRQLTIDARTALAINARAQNSRDANFRPGWHQVRAEQILRTDVAETPDRQREVSGYAVEQAQAEAE